MTDKPAMLVRSKTVVGGEVNPSEVPVLAEPSPEECETVWPELPKIRGKGKLSDKQITAAVMRAISAVNARHAAQSAGATDASDI